MSRWELLKAFHEISRILFLENPAEVEETVQRIKVIVLNVLTENADEAPPTFGRAANKEK